MEELKSKEILEENEQKTKKIDKNKILKVIKFLFKRWFIDAFTGMAQGLFCTLIAGTILAQIAVWIGSAGTQAGISVGKYVGYVASLAKMLMGAGIGVGIANQLKAPKLVMFSAAVAGLAGAFADKIIDGTLTASFAPGNPIGAYVVALIAIELGMLICGKTKVDIVLIPLFMMIVSLVCLYVAWPFIEFVNLMSKGIALATAVTPLVMGIVVAVVMGILLTLPTSSAAMWIAIATPILTTSTDLAMIDAMYLAGGAATVGCACQMVGFAVQSFRENKWGGLIAQGLGTSMLQIPNLMRHPMIMLPPVIASAIAGPISTVVFGLRCGAAGGGMGTSGLVGVFDVISASQGIVPDWKIGLGITVCMFIIPVVVCLAVSELLRKYNLIKFGDMSLEL